jgi:uncharacterized membrane protein YeaQ/YmgE (transglycosylase-associated protein family)
MVKKLRKQTILLSGVIGAIVAIWLVSLLNNQKQTEGDETEFSTREIMSLAMKVIKLLRNFVDRTSRN